MCEYGTVLEFELAVLEAQVLIVQLCLGPELGTIPELLKRCLFLLELWHFCYSYGVTRPSEVTLKELKVCFKWALYLEWVGLLTFWSEALGDFQGFLPWAVFSHGNLIILVIEDYAILCQPGWSTNDRRPFSLPDQHRSWHICQKWRSWNTQYCWR